MKSKYLVNFTVLSLPYNLGNLPRASLLKLPIIIY
jgi:hypothetical protein